MFYIFILILIVSSCTGPSEFINTKASDIKSPPNINIKESQYGYIVNGGVY